MLAHFPEQRLVIEPKHGLGEKKGGGARRLCFDAAYSPTCNYPVRHMSIR